MPHYEEMKIEEFEKVLNERKNLNRIRIKGRSFISVSLRDINFDNMQLNNCLFSDCSFPHKISNCNFYNCTIACSDLKFVEFDDCGFACTDIIEVSLMDNKFTECDFDLVNLNGDNISLGDDINDFF